MKKIVQLGGNLILRLILTVAISACALVSAQNLDGNKSRDCCKSKYQGTSLAARSTDALGKEYLRLKHKTCNACKDNYSDFHVIMRALGERLNGKTRAEIEQVMGSPDTVKSGALVYYWRYEHDYLRFQLATDGIATSSWFNALE
jgi:hypothetical protein